MTRLISGLDLNVWRSIYDTLPRAAKLIHYDHIHMICEVELMPATILKAYDDEICLDLGGEKISFNTGDFEYIELR